MIACVVLLLVVVGALSWRYFGPDPFKASERIVRESRRTLSVRVRDFEQDLRAAVTKAAPGERGAVIDSTVARAVKKIDEYVDGARDELSQLDIPLAKYENRANRLADNAEAAKRMIEERAAEKRSQLSGE